MAALGMETSSGDFEVIDLCFAGFPDLATPEAGPSHSNGSTKGKEKAKGDDDEGELSALRCFSAHISRRENLGGIGIRSICRIAGSASGSEGSTAGRMAHGREWRCSGMSLLYARQLMGRTN